jgi:hypothetical protein
MAPRKSLREQFIEGDLLDVFHLQYEPERVVTAG